MKISVVHNLGTGGARRALHAHLSGLAARGHRLHLFAPRASEHYEPLAPVCHENTLYGPEAAVRPASTAGGDMGRARRFARRVLGNTLYEQARDLVWVGKQQQAARQMEALYETIAHDVLTSAPDVVYVHQCQQLLVPRSLLTHLAGSIPVVFYLHDTLRRAQEWAVQSDDDYDHMTPHLLRRREFGRVLSPALLGLRIEERTRYEQGLHALAGSTNARVLVNSYFSRESTLRTSGVEAQVCYFAVDTDFWTPPPPGVGRRLEVLSVGALRPEKRHDRIIAAVAAIPSERRPPLRLVGYPMQSGDDPYTRYLRHQAEQSQVQLILDSEISDEALRLAYRSAAVAVFAPYLEPFGLVPLEAMACGAPTVAVAEAGLRETVRDGVGVLTNGTVEAMTSAIDTLLQAPEHAAQLGMAGRRWAETWTWERSLDTLEGHLRAVQSGVVA